MRAAVLDQDGMVVNIIVVDDLSFDPGEGFTLVEAGEGIDIGMIIDVESQP